MKNIKIALWGIPALLTVLWVAAALPFPETLSVIAIRNLLVQYSGVLSLGVMSVAMILATRAKWIEPWLNGLDKSYRLHKWLGIMVLVTSVVHWFASNAPKWAVSLGLMEAPERGAPSGAVPDIGAIQAFFNSQRGLAETLGDLPFKILVILTVIALVRRIPYKFFAKTHTLLAVTYLAFVFHGTALLDFAAWTQPLGIVVALLMVGGVISALLALTRQIGRGNRVSGKVEAIRTFPELDATAVNIAMETGWNGHEAGQFAFITFDRKEGKHPFTIASAWDPAARSITVISKALGDYTKFLPDMLKAGGEAIVEGPYGRFTFEDAKQRQIWIGGGVGITPFIAKMKELAATPGTKTIDLIHSTKEHSPEALEMLQSDAEAAGITIHLLVDDRDGFLTGDRLRDLVPDWKSASVWFCGPAGFGEALRHDLLANGFAARDFHQELFNMR
ncbi:ferredoxin reductase family protein [Litoreibacter janthinus]|uniref:Predicted ferric reductase n=1 Tax=Litoreibacter janthinus TaxID=670154 RepID=A0A1I6H5Q6_9RHOB|nr:ferric reductase-like transmembrane domain-containing protein [Litoreibacter janthinus]SFR49611.1 Predicted ferric reductase [Litoreibacter janthinus]